MADQTKNTQENAKEAQPNNLVAKKAKKDKSVKFDGRIALFGCRAAGKTVYIGSLFHEHHGHKAGLDVDFVGKESARYLQGLQRSILQYPRKWPAPNVIENELRLELKLDSALAASSPKVTLQLFDPPGEWLALGSDDQIDEQQGGAQAMRDFVAGADGILFFFEPDNFAFQVLRDKIKRALSELQAWAQTVDERLESLITSLTKKDADILALLQAKQLDNQFDEVKGILESAQKNEETAKNLERLLKGLFRDAELSYRLKKYELNVEPILANAQEVSYTKTPTGKPVDVLYRIVEYIQKTVASEKEDYETILLQSIESYFRLESNNRLLAAVMRLQEINKKAEEDATAENRSIAVIITKADELAVFRQSPERPYVLIPPHLEHLKFKTGEDRLDKLREALKHHWEKQDARWGSIIDQLLTGPFKALFSKLMSFPGNFQIFFVSSVGDVERNKDGTVKLGKNGFVQPPQGENNFQPQGVDQPILWIAQQIYSHAMVHQAMRRTLRWAIFPLLLLLIPIALFTYNVFLQSALERENDSVLQTSQSYKWLESLPMPPKHAITIRIALLDFQHHWVAYQQNHELFSSPYKDSYETLKAQLEILIQSSNRLNANAQHQAEIQMLAKQLSTIVDIERRHLIAWQKYQQLHNRLKELNLIGSKNEIASLLIQAKEVKREVKNGLTNTDKIVSSDVIDSTQKKIHALQQMQQTIPLTIEMLEDYQKNGVPITFEYASANVSNMTLWVPLKNGGAQQVKKGKQFRWLPTQDLPMVLKISNIELTKLYQVGDFYKEITIEVTDTNRTVNLLDTWFSYAETLEAVLKPYDKAWLD